MSNATLNFAISFLADGVSNTLALNVLESPFWTAGNGAPQLAVVFGGRLGVPTLIINSGTVGSITSTGTVDPGGNVEFTFSAAPPVGIYSLTGTFVF